MKEKIKKSKERGIITMEKQRLRKNKGITLIALVITIIVILILAGVSIAMLTGQNGILTQATNAKENTVKAEEEEKIKMAVEGSSISDNGLVEMIDETSFKQELQNQFGNQQIDVETIRDGSFIITITDTQRKYYVDNDKTVLNSDNIIEITTVDELKAFRDDVNNGNTYEGKVVLLMNDIDLSGEEWEPIGIYQEDSTNPNDEDNIAFKGIFDGCFNTISGMHTNSTFKNRGLFGFIEEATIKNVGTVNGNIQGTARTGAIVGYAYNNSIIINCYNSSNVNTTDNYGGGIVGFINKQSVIENCFNSGNISSSSAVGGIVGGVGNSTVKNCYNAGMVEGNQVGGVSFSVIGSGLIENCYNVGILKATVATSINCSGNSSAKVIFNNNYYLENTINGANDTYKQEECKVKNNQEMKSLYSILGNSFKEDTENINNGYPILFWQ